MIVYRESLGWIVVGKRRAARHPLGLTQYALDVVVILAIVVLLVWGAA